MDEIMEKVQEFLALYGLRIVGSVLIFVIGLVIAKVLRAIVRRIMVRSKAAPLLVSFVSQMAYVAILIFVVVAALSKLGVQTASIIAVVGAMGLAVGLALQGSLANFAAGVLLVIFRPFRVDDFVEINGESGTVEDIQILTTTLVTPDNRRVIVPNAQVTGGNIINYTGRGTRRVDLVIGIGYGADIQHAKEAIEAVLRGDSRVLEDPEPVVAVSELAGSSVNLAVRPWVDASEYWNVRFDLLEAIKVRLDREGINIPFPQQDVHLFQEST